MTEFGHACTDFGQIRAHLDQSWTELDHMCADLDQIGMTPGQRPNSVRSWSSSAKFGHMFAAGCIWPRKVATCKFTRMPSLVNMGGLRQRANGGFVACGGPIACGGQRWPVACNPMGGSSDPILRGRLSLAGLFVGPTASQARGRGARAEGPYASWAAVSCWIGVAGAGAGAPRGLPLAPPAGVVRRGAPTLFAASPGRARSAGPVLRRRRHWRPLSVSDHLS